jgi:acetyl esterase/lipase
MSGTEHRGGGEPGAVDLFDRLRSAGSDNARPLTTYSYGDLPDQVADLRLPEGSGTHPVAVVLHGGFWRARWTRDIMSALAVALTGAGWATWNVEYRRVGAGGGVPQTLDDVLAACDMVGRVEAPLDRQRTIALGHSAGGHLALWLASQRQLFLTVSLAGVTCLAEAARLGIGSNAVRDFCGGLPSEVPEAYALADPFDRLPLGVPQLIVHGDRDDNVPVELAGRWADRSRERGDDCELAVLRGVDHFALIDPSSDAWSEISRRLPPARPGLSPGQYNAPVR